MRNATCTVTFADGTPCPRDLDHPSTGWCHPCHEWSRRHGGADPGSRVGQRGKGALQELLRAAAHATTDQCIYLTTSTGARARATVNGSRTQASRAVWKIRHGDPGERDVLHSCNGGSGESGCINIRHLYLGDDHQNTADKLAAGRSNRGTRHGNHKLTEAEVREIRRRYRPRDRNGNSARALAAEFGVSTTCIHHVVTGNRWDWLQ